MEDQNAKSTYLEQQVDKLKADNVKLTTDIKVIRSEHSEIMHSVVTIEKRNQQLV